MGKKKEADEEAIQESQVPWHIFTLENTIKEVRFNQGWRQHGIRWIPLFSISDPALFLCLQAR